MALFIIINFFPIMWITFPGIIFAELYILDNQNNIDKEMWDWNIFKQWTSYSTTMSCFEMKSNFALSYSISKVSFQSMYECNFCIDKWIVIIVCVSIVDSIDFFYNPSWKRPYHYNSTHSIHGYRFVHDVCEPQVG